MIFDKLRKEFRSNNLYDNLFLLIGVIVQIIVFIGTNSTWLCFISGVSGIFSVVLCAQRKISQFVFSFIQLFTYVAIVLQEKLYGEVIENIFYFITMILGIFVWVRGYNDKKDKIDVKSLTWVNNGLVIILTIIGVWLFYIYLSSTDDTQPLLDSISTVPAFVAQILLMLRYKENWWYWLTIDIAAIFMWCNASNPIMVAQYVFWTLNCVYGMIKWKN